MEEYIIEILSFLITGFIGWNSFKTRKKHDSHKTKTKILIEEIREQTKLLHQTSITLNKKIEDSQQQSLQQSGSNKTLKKYYSL